MMPDNHCYFFASSFFERSLVGDVGVVGLPGNLVQFYTAKGSIARSAMGAKVVRVNAAMVVLRWMTVREGARNSPKTPDLGIKDSTLPFEWSGEILDPGFSLRMVPPTFCLARVNLMGILGELATCAGTRKGVE
jgi:hypothetical protein